MKKNGLVIIGIIIAFILGGLVIYVTLVGDNKGPVITVDTTKVKPYAAEQGTDTLKQYATAIDKVDGDVSDSLVIENVYVLSDLYSAKVVYVARDKKNNVTKYSSVIEYLPSDQELAEKSAVDQGEEQAKQAETKETETTASETKDSAQTSSTGSATTKGETTTQQTTVAGAPQMVLTATEATLKKGTTFDIEPYIQELTDSKDSKATLSKRVVVSGNYSNSTPGDYVLDIYCTNTRQIESNHTKFTLHIIK